MAIQRFSPHPPLDCSWPACSPVAHAELVDTLGFERKRSWLRRRLDELRAVYANHTTDLRVSRTGTHTAHTHVRVARGSGRPLRLEDLLQDSCSALLHEGPEALRGHFTVGFLNEEGVGAGVRREWFHAISQEVRPGFGCVLFVVDRLRAFGSAHTGLSRRLQLFNPDNALFVQSAEGVALQPNPHSHVNADHLSYLHFAGRLIGIGLLVLPLSRSLSLSGRYHIFTAHATRAS